MPSKKTVAVIEILAACVFWGFGFVSTIWTLKDMSPAGIVFYRFILAGLASIGIFLLSQYFTKKKNSWKLIWTSLKRAAPAGFAMGVMMLLQTWGMLTTTAGKSAFITVLYVIFVPFIEIIFYKRKIHASHGFAVLLAVFGIVLMTKVELGPPVIGDILTLGCAVAAALHIIYVGKLSQAGSGVENNLFLINAGQFLWAGSLALLLLPMDGSWDLFALSSMGWIGMLSLTFGSGLLAFYFMFRAQRSIESSKAAVLYLLESPISAIFGFIFLKEILDFWQLVGGAFILAGCLLAIKPHRDNKTFQS